MFLKVPLPHLHLDGVVDVLLWRLPIRPGRPPGEAHLLQEVSSLPSIHGLTHADIPSTRLGRPQRFSHSSLEDGRLSHIQPLRRKPHSLRRLRLPHPSLERRRPHTLRLRLRPKRLRRLRSRLANPSLGQWRRGQHRERGQPHPRLVRRCFCTERRRRQQ